MRILVLNGAPAGADAAALLGCVERVDGVLRPVRMLDLPARGGAEAMPARCAALLAECGWRPRNLDLIAAVVGPGSFTGLRASLALAQGLALGAGCDLLGVTAGEALASALQDEAGAGATVLCLSVARRGRIFVEQPGGNGDGTVRAQALDGFVLPPGPLLLAGNAAAETRAALGGARTDIALSRWTAPDGVMIAGAALARRAAGRPARDVLPLYVDPPEAKLPAAGLRPAPS
ncbi:peptidase M22 glycoprotease [Gluconacetobacter diazotrophicus PA1 5]|uniref:Glycoprotease protein n=2 Tax=Gluconacetobacter diazotrophicus TaxID=33996 RepID=A9HFB3_GLUDA|nr:tRNA (adenosine(37)-N6)-threonylcarbamoyltransferase complex dimerization subunit type 1 TsaB [Gluconacetobacter diazotrophicus]ACI51856.1 peptidase M22 glycoprotease [Gluconacetobacter diazotrophicus PA1 5]MBB2155588.1 tRNA (adenosine(37)-N6)-threonylcarbamoyltransferase complex dimerization subunit type 1 TsaB [Gluconacetobacter diazotrophicus]TWB11201.1 tRNA threonylcarbamoyl adenosine modification protein YeaZ [Gluconacetobacter diazotrophicus]CAP55337.1 Glycoprotease protein [Gluconacet